MFFEINLSAFARAQYWQGFQEEKFFKGKSLLPKKVPGAVK